MERYKVEWRGKTYISLGESAVEAMDRFANRRTPVGNTWIFEYSLKQYDADTRGKNWAQFKTSISDGERMILVSLAD